MGKFCGNIGYAETSETSQGVYMPTITERKVYGDILKNTKKYEKGDSTNDDITVNNRISFIADPYAQKNFHLIRYCTFMGTQWKVTDVTVEYPRLVLTLGGVYNG